MFLQADRHVEFHSQGGIYYRTRVPKVPRALSPRERAFAANVNRRVFGWFCPQFGRDLAYNRANCDLIVVGASNEAWRLNLDQGRFLNSFETKSPALNVRGRGCYGDIGSSALADIFTGALQLPRRCNRRAR